jgi:hypothetical protein
MQIIIKYEASWQNSFLSGSNNEPLPKNGRSFIGSMTNLKKRDKDGNYSNFIKREISHDTIMGVLNRLIGDQRKLYQTRQCPKYFFADIESRVKFENIHNQSKPLNSEMVYIRNMTGSADQNSFTGMIKGDDPIFSSDYSDQLWGILTLDFDALCDFITDQNFKIENEIKFDPSSTINKLGQLDKLKPVLVNDSIQKALSKLQEAYPDADYVNDKGVIKPIMFYCSSLYLQISRLGKEFDLSSALTKSGGISGISKRGFTPKDFMDRFTTGSKKLIWGNPFILKERRKGEGEVVSTLTKANGKLKINLGISKEKSLELEQMIQNAGVSSFYLGKKGLAYVEEIRI